MGNRAVKALEHAIGEIGLKCVIQFERHQGCGIIDHTGKPWRTLSSLVLSGIRRWPYHGVREIVAIVRGRRNGECIIACSPCGNVSQKRSTGVNSCPSMRMLTYLIENLPRIWVSASVSRESSTYLPLRHDCAFRLEVRLPLSQRQACFPS